jgi:SAM-dependent methyltransferase
LCGVSAARFEIQDVRYLSKRDDLTAQFDVAICCECIEHIMDDRALMTQMARCLKPGGRLLLTTPYHHYRAITRGDDGPFSTVEDGWHLRRGHTRQMLEELCAEAGLRVEAVSYCTGFLSQKITGLLRTLSRVHDLLGWAAVLPLRPLPPVFDRLVTPLIGWPYYSIGLEAYKPRFAAAPGRPPAGGGGHA